MSKRYGQNRRIVMAMALLLLLTLPLARAHAQCGPPSSGLNGWWTLDETSGTSIIDYASSNNGTVQNGLDPATDSAAGEIGNALYFDHATGDYIQTTNNYFKTANDITLSAWIDPTAAIGSSMYHILWEGDGLGNGGGAEYEFSLLVGVVTSGMGDDHIQFFIEQDGASGESAADINIKTTFSARNSWHHVAVTVTNLNSTPSATLYVDGVAVGSDTAAGAIPRGTWDTDLRIGADGTTTRGFTGYIDDVRVYNRALAADEIAGLYATRLAANYPAGYVFYDTQHASMLYCNGTDWVHMGTGSYNPSAVHFDGSSDNLIRGSGLTGAADSKKFTLNMWFRTTDSDGGEFITDSSGYFLVEMDNTGAILLRATDPGGTVRLNAGDLTGSSMNDGQWHHILYSTNMDDTDYLVVDGALKPAINGSGTFDTGATLDFTQSDWAIGDDTTGSYKLDVDLADLWIDFGTYIDFSIEANRRKFISENGLPMYLGPDGSIPTGSKPDIFLSGDDVTFSSNRGTGGAFTASGTLTFASAQPADCTPEAGSLNLIDNVAPGNQSSQVWGDGTYIYDAEGNGELYAYSFDGVSFTSVGATSGGSQTAAVWGDGTYLYTANINNNFNAWSFDGSTFTLKGTFSVASQAWSVWGDGTYIYMVEKGILHAVTFDGTNFNEVASYTLPLSTQAGSVWGDGTYIYVTNSTAGLFALRFNGTSFSLSGSTASPATNPLDVWGDGTYLYVPDNNNGLYAMTFDGSTFTQVGTRLTGLHFWKHVWGDGTYIYVPTYFSSLGTFGVYQFDGSTFNLVDSDTAATNAIGNVWGDGKYVYWANASGGVRAYSGFKTCHCGVSEQGGNLVKPGLMSYNPKFNVMQYCNGTEWVAMGPTGGTPPTNGLLGWWKLDEASGTTVADSSTSGNNGTMQAGLDASADSVSGRVGNALHFDGVDDYIGITPYTNADSFTVSLWVNPQSVSDDAVFVTNVESTSPWNGWSLMMDRPLGNCADGDVCMWMYSAGTGGDWIDFAYDFPANTWTHFVATYSTASGYLKFYADGVEIYKELTAVAPDTSLADTASIGRGAPVWTPSDQFFNGSMDDVRIYNRALSAQEIQQLYHYGMSGGLGDVSANCANPSMPEGAMFYNIDFNVMQYCNGEQWIGIGQ